MISGIFTSLAFIMFAGVTYWAYSRHNRARFDEASRLPLMEDELQSHAASCCSSRKNKEMSYEWPPCQCSSKEARS